MRQLLIHFFCILIFISFLSLKEADTAKFIIYKVDLKKQHIEMFWKDERGNRYGNFIKLKEALQVKGQSLRFAMNGGMYQKDGSPLGLYIEKGKMLHRLNTTSGYGNFYLKPNGVFYITSDNKAGVSTSENFSPKNVTYATQSGPMLVIDGAIHKSFTPGSDNLHIRNAVGVASSTEVYFVISKDRVSFYEIASLFKDELKCNNALYLDGFVSRVYLPSQERKDTDGDFGVIIGEFE